MMFDGTAAGVNHLTMAFPPVLCPMLVRRKLGQWRSAVKTLCSCMRWSCDMCMSSKWPATSVPYALNCYADNCCKVFVCPCTQELHTRTDWQLYGRCGALCDGTVLSKVRMSLVMLRTSEDVICHTATVMTSLSHYYWNTYVIFHIIKWNMSQVRLSQVTGKKKAS